MLKLTIKPGEYINIGDDVRVIYSGGSEGNIHLLIDAPRELNIVRSKVLARNTANSDIMRNADFLRKHFLKSAGL
ncbi:MAG: hypothetical protein BHW22_06050 [Eubacterium sp. CAG76_36_125]|nr:MAG: hypothetical protein BHW22_06050 [Eubacterium sp. CAG76_36_125]